MPHRREISKCPRDMSLDDVDMQFHQHCNETSYCDCCAFLNDSPSKGVFLGDIELSLNVLRAIADARDISCLTSSVSNDGYNELETEYDRGICLDFMNHSENMDPSTVNEEIGRHVEASHFATVQNKMAVNEMFENVVLENVNLSAAIHEHSGRKECLDEISIKNDFLYEQNHAFEADDVAEYNSSEIEQMRIAVSNNFDGEITDGEIDTELNTTLAVEADLNSSEETVNFNASHASVIAKIVQKKGKKRKKSSLWCRRNPKKVKRTLSLKRRLGDVAVEVTNGATSDGDSETVSKNAEANEMKLDEQDKDQSQFDCMEETTIEEPSLSVAAGCILDDSSVVEEKMKNYVHNENKEANDCMEDTAIEEPSPSISASCFLDYSSVIEEIHDDVDNENKEGKGVQKQSPLPCKRNRALLTSEMALSKEDAELYREPFKFGWRREVVIRKTIEDDEIHQCDVYYILPTGAKFRSKVQLRNWISTNSTSLTIENFTFMRRAIGVESGEVVRHAGASRGRISMENKRKEANKSKVFDYTGLCIDKPVIMIERVSDKFLHPIKPPVISSDVSRTYDTGPSTLSAETEVLAQKKPPAKRGRKPKVRPLVCEKDIPEKVQEEEKVKNDKELIQVSNEAVIVSPANKETVIRASVIATDVSETIDIGPPMSAKTGVSLQKKTPAKRGRKPKIRSVVCDNIDNPKKVQEEEKVKSDKEKLMQVPNEVVDVSPSDNNVMRVTARESTSENNIKKHSRVENRCSLICQMNHMPPVLHCIVCMSLFHEECVNFENDGFVCPRCRGATPSTSEEQINTGKEVQIMTISTPISLNEITSNIWRTSSASIPSMCGLSQSPFASKPPTTNREFKRTHCKQGKSTCVSQSLSNPLMTSTPYEIRPHIRIHKLSLKQSTKSTYAPTKEEPLDDSYVTTNNDKGQDSAEALGNLKSIRNLQSPSTSLQEGSVHTSGGICANMTTNKLIPNLSSLLHFEPMFSSSLPVKMPSVVRIGNNNFQGTQNLQSPIGALGNMQCSQNSGYMMGQMPGLSKPGMMSVTSAQAISFLVQKQNSQARVATIDYMKTVSSNQDKHNVSRPTKQRRGAINEQFVKLIPSGKPLTLSQPLGLLINGRLIMVPPSRIFESTEGLKVFVPPNTSTFDDQTDDVCAANNTQDNNVCSESHTCAVTDINLDSKEKVNEYVIQNSGLDAIENKRSDRVTEKEKERWLFKQVFGGSEYLFRIFSCLGLKDLLSASAVCRSWRMLSMLPALWNHVSFAGVIVSNWQMAMQIVNRQHVQSVSFVGLLHFKDPNRTWFPLVSSLQDLPSLQKISFGLVPFPVVQEVCGRFKELKSFCAENITDSIDTNPISLPTKLDIGVFSCLLHLEELCLKGTGGISLLYGMNLFNIGALKVLHLTSLKDASAKDFSFISKLLNLRELAIGDCDLWTQETYSYLQSLSSLEILQLENGGAIPDKGLGQALDHLSKLKTLKLYDYIIADTLGTHIGKLNYLKTLVIKPDNTLYPEDVNTNTLLAIAKLSGKSLKYLHWFIPISSSNTSIILGNNENPKRSTLEQNQQWIPFRCITESNINASFLSLKSGSNVCKYLSVQQLIEMLAKMLPDTKISVIERMFE